MTAFGLTDLAFFATPRPWPEITARFAAWRPAALLDAILAADTDGGAGLLLWRPKPLRAWQLTDRGRAHVARGGRP